MRFSWRDAGRHYLQVAAFCAVVAALTNAIWPRRGYPTQLAYALCVGTITWVVVEFGRLAINPPEHRGWPRGARGLALAAVGIALGMVFGARLADALFGDGRRPSARDDAVSWAVTAVAASLACYFFYARGKAAELSARASTAERDAAEARLKLLAAQLEPHMLFNTLANLRALIASDPVRAVAMLDRLNDYLRVTLAGSREPAHPLAAEFDHLGDYLELMSVRMGPRLAYALDLPDDLRGTPVPPLLLQPLVENAVRHGLEPKVEGGAIAVRACRERTSEGDRLVLAVCDTGVGLGAARPRGGSGFGLTQVRERVASLYGARGVVTLLDAPAGGTHATLTLPL